MPRWKFIGLILLFYFFVNLLYSFVYLAVGLDQLQGVIATTVWGNSKIAYFFSAETFTTVGYWPGQPGGRRRQYRSGHRGLQRLSCRFRPRDGLDLRAFCAAKKLF